MKRGLKARAGSVNTVVPVSRTSGEVTRLLARVSAGEPGAEERLVELIYAELRRLAASHLRRERRDHTLSPTALAHEAWLRFSTDLSKVEVASRRQFFAVAAIAMRRILVEHARARRAQKRGGAIQLVKVDILDSFAAPTDDQILALDDALTALMEIRPRAARIVSLRFFGGLTHTEIAGLLELERRTVDRDWAFARAWLFDQLRGNVTPSGDS
jgi:RNA polymerase sigma factor (TIGR02999 family)